MFDLGMQELIVIFVVALLVFGPKRLPELGKTLGKWMVEIRRGINIARAQMEDEMRDANFKLPDDIAATLPKELQKEMPPAAGNTDSDAAADDKTDEKDKE